VKPTKDTYAITPFYPESGENEIKSLILELHKVVGGLSGIINHHTASAMAELVVTMNSYYSNLIEGQFTHPLDIEKALKKDYSEDEKKRTLQLETEAHINVNRAMRVKLKTGDTKVCSTDFLCWLHHEFYSHLPISLRKVETNNQSVWTVTPGQLRSGDMDVTVGNHIAPSAEALPAFMEIFEKNYSPENIKDPVKHIVAIAASHHRLAWIHPFLDGNGRVIRLFSEAFFIKEGLDANGLWSISRGLAVFKKQYYAHLNNADHIRTGDYDGRGNLSDRYLGEWCIFFLKTAIDQVKFMNSLFDIEGLMDRIDAFTDLMVTRKELRAESKYLLQEVFLRGEVRRSEVERIINKSEKVARPLMKDLLDKGLLKSEGGHSSTLKINFPVKYAPYLFPKLYPADIEASIVAEG
jgi:Fic family protein